MRVSFMRHSVLGSSLITALCWTLSCTLSHAGSSPSRGLSVNLRAKWPAAPTILEAYEFLVRCMTPQAMTCTPNEMHIANHEARYVAAGVAEPLIRCRRKRLQISRQNFWKLGRLNLDEKQANAGMLCSIQPAHIYLALSRR